MLVLNRGGGGYMGGGGPGNGELVICADLKFLYET